jgi:hypothetical protein
MSQSTFSLLPVSPFPLDLTVWTLRRRPHNAVDRWHPYGGLIYFHLLLDRLADAGFLQPGSPQPPTSGSNHIDFQDVVFTGDHTNGT